MKRLVVRRMVLFGSGLALVAVTSGAPQSAGGVDFSSYLRTRPFVHLFTETNDCGKTKAVNQLTGTGLTTELTQLTTWFTHFHGEASNNFPLGTQCKGSSSTTLAAKLASNGAMVSNYRNGSYVSQSSPGMMNFGEAGNLEQAAPLSIATFWPGEFRPSGGSSGASQGRLIGALTSTATTVNVTATGSSRPGGAPATWPYLDSRGAGLNSGAYSSNTHDFVSWIRLDDELMKVVSSPSISGSTVTLRVQRGVFGTARTSHGANTRVMSPVYIGGAAGSDGSPGHNSTRSPLRYAIKIWQPSAYRWIASRINSTFGPGLQGYNTVWLDITSCGLSNTIAGPGHAVAMWDDPHTTTLSSTQWGSYQAAKVNGLRAALPGVKFTGNSLDWPTSCNQSLMGSLNGASLENWLKDGSWKDSMTQSIAIQANNLPGIYWARWNQKVSNAAAYRRFTYGSLLLTYRSAATRFQYGGPWGFTKPDTFFFWNWGSPATNPSTIGATRLASKELYVRSFSHGLIIVNPTRTTLSKKIAPGYFDVIHLTSGGLPRAVTSVSVPGHDAAFLLKP